ncbi:MAG: ParA family protein [Cyanothece sp. SIO2G6]|nr:ParA family protein [Cyanothece sp. SIO2G6]
MIIAIASFKGGVGKTTTAMHLAGFLQTHGRTLLIDTDPNQSAIAWANRGQLPFDVIDEWHDTPAHDYRHVVIDTQARPTPKDFAILADSCEFLILQAASDGSLTGLVHNSRARKAWDAYRQVGQELLVLGGLA